jgi:hypothetical protein
VTNARPPSGPAGDYIAQLDEVCQIAVWRGIDARALELGRPDASRAAMNIGHRIAGKRARAEEES